MEVEKVDRNAVKRLLMWIFAASVVLGGLGFLFGRVQAAQITDWSRVKGRVIKIDQKANVITLLDADGYPLTIKLDADASIVSGKEIKPLKDIGLGDKVGIVNLPQAPKPKDPDEPPVGGVYK